MLRFNRHRHPNRRDYADWRLNPDDSSSSAEIQSPPPPQPPPPATTAKPNPKFLSFILQAFIMTLVFSLFFVFVGIAVIIFLHLCLVGGALHRRHRRRSRFRNRLETDEQPGLSPSDLKSLPELKFRPGSTELCAICLENCADGDWCRELPDCKHAFHSNCVDRWLAKSPGCPVCRTAVRIRCAGENDDDAAAGFEDSSARLWYAFG